MEQLSITARVATACGALPTGRTAEDQGPFLALHALATKLRDEGVVFYADDIIALICMFLHECLCV